MAEPATLQLNKAHWPVTVLGPGRRIGLWVQGCTIDCKGCVSQDTWPQDATKAIAVRDLVAWCKRTAGDALDGVTISGGEPFEQPDGLRALLAGLRAWRRVGAPRLRHPLLQRLPARDAASASTRRRSRCSTRSFPSRTSTACRRGTCGAARPTSRWCRCPTAAARAMPRIRRRARRRRREADAGRGRRRAHLDDRHSGPRRHGGGRGAVRESRARPYESVVAQVKSAAWPTRTSASVPSVNARIRRSARAARAARCSRASTSRSRSRRPIPRLRPT